MALWPGFVRRSPAPALKPQQVFASAAHSARRQGGRDYFSGFVHCEDFARAQTRKNPLHSRRLLADINEAKIF